jgi:type III restriction enzyme
MKLQFKEQQFQADAVRAVADCFSGQPLKTNRFTLERSKEIIRRAQQAASGEATLDLEHEVMEAIGYRNSPVYISERQILENIKSVQRRNEIHESEHLEHQAGMSSGYNLTIEMETGTGKTYTYIRTMYELHKKYGWSKYIVVVPSVAIREGVYKSFQITQDHFQERYGHKIAPFIYNSGRPQDIETFASNSRISVMIINTQAFNATGADARRIHQVLDQFGTRKPIDIIAQTNPILIIDEPQSVDGKKTLESMQQFKPLFTLRYSATHRIEYNKIYRLDALDAYNKKLVKKIEVKGIDLKSSTGTSGYVYLEDIVKSTGDPLAYIEFEQRSGQGVKRVRKKVEKGANLFELSKEMPAYRNMMIEEIYGNQDKIVVSGMDIPVGGMLNNSDESTYRRIQIRETVKAHLNKEKQLFDKGVKVLTLFFIDSVDKYRVYDEEGRAALGEYAKMFEEEYDNYKNEFFDLFRPEFNQYLHASDIHKGYFHGSLPEYLVRDTADKVHEGYFSIDKKKRLVDPSVKRNSEESDDASAYDLIMKDKERLLSFSEPARFIFSHSALKEGWDNPNVFQICTLKNPEGGSEIRRRQEVGRGMRLCVNQEGVRLDEEMVGDLVHDINKLTVVASESYETFAEGLQKETMATLKDRPQKAEVEFFVDKMVENAVGEKHRLNREDAEKLNKILYKHDTIDIDNKITEAGKEQIEREEMHLPDNLEPYRASIAKLLKSIYAADALKPKNGRDYITLHTNENFKKKEFQELWKRISHKTIYEVRFDTPKLIQDSASFINRDLNIADTAYEVRSGEQKETGTKADLEHKTHIVLQKRERHKLRSNPYHNTKYDIVGEIESLTNLKRQTIVAILRKIGRDKFFLLKKNPEEFIAKCGKIINEAKANLIINNIAYHKIDDTYDVKKIFTNDNSAVRSAPLLMKHIYDHLTSDSKIEAKFAKSLEQADEVVVYAKLPKSFYITTPVGRYSPDWAVVFDREKVRHIYFVAETKGSGSSMDLRGTEKLKIHCAEIHFEEICGKEVKYGVVDSYDKLMDLVQLN